MLKANIFVTFKIRPTEFVGNIAYKIILHHLCAELKEHIFLHVFISCYFTIL